VEHGIAADSSFRLRNRMMRSPVRVIAAAAVCLLLVPSCGPRVSSGGGTPGRASGRRDEAWAQPIALPGVPNFHRVTADLYRSAQPTAEGMAQLSRFGIKTIVNLRTLHSDDDEIGHTPLDYVHVPMLAWRPREEDVRKFLDIAMNGERTPVLVHCNYGADRTGFMCAVYRVAACGWSKEEAVAEMVEGGFGFHMLWRDLIEYIEEVDIDAVRGAIGRAGPTCTTPDRHFAIYTPCRFGYNKFVFETLKGGHNGNKGHRDSRLGRR
jgi:protein tyrosine phosphatase (PTP) superfamily phosphohydrolase (DUF442 family)